MKNIEKDYQKESNVKDNLLLFSLYNSVDFVDLVNFGNK